MTPAIKGHNQPTQIQEAKVLQPEGQYKLVKIRDVFWF